jgi:hypothetical protein
MSSVIERINYAFDRLEFLRNLPGLDPNDAWDLYVVTDVYKKDLEQHRYEPEVILGALEMDVAVFRGRILYGTVTRDMEDLSLITWM